jgi:hypothetical protein
MRARMYFFTDPLIQYAVEYFRRVDFADPAQGDRFWRLFTPGNTISIMDRPFEQLSDYEIPAYALPCTSGRFSSFSASC